MQSHAVSARADTREPQPGVHHSPGHPDHGAGRIIGGVGAPGSPSTTMTPCGSPATADGGPTVPGAASAGVLSLGVNGSGGRIDRSSTPGKSFTSRDFLTKPPLVANR